MPGIRHLHGDVLDMVRDALTNDAARARGLYRKETVDALLAAPNETRTTLGSNTLVATRGARNVVAEYGELVSWDSRFADLRRVAVAGCDRVRPPRRRWRLSAGGAALSARLARELVA